MFLTCEGTLGIVPATMDYSGRDFHAGYQQIEGINLGYLQINGTQMFALAQVLSQMFKDIPRTTISKKMETLKIKRRRCDLAELRTLKAIRSVPTRAVKCSLISKADLEALCTSCKSLSPRSRRKRRRKSRRREQLLLPGPREFFPCPRPPPCRAGGCCGAPGRAAPLPGPQQLHAARGGLFAAVLAGSHRDLIGSPRDLIGPPRDLVCSPRDFTGSPRDFTDSPRELSGSHRDLTGSPRDFTGSPRDLVGPPRDFTGSPRDLVGPPRDFTGSPRDFIDSPRDFTGTPRDLTGSPRDLSGSPRDFTGPPRDFTGPPRDLPPLPPPCWPGGLLPHGAGTGKGRARGSPASKRQGNSAGYSSDSDSSLDLAASSPATSSDSSEEEEEEEGDSSCSSEEGSSSESESSSLCSGDSVQSTRYRQAALPRFQPPREPLGEERPAEPPPSKALRPDPELLFLSQQLWARTLRATTLESWSAAAAPGAQPGLYARHEASPSSSSSSSSSSPPPSPSSTPGVAPAQKELGFGDAGGKDLHKDAWNNTSSSSERPSGAPAGAAPCSEPPPELRASPGPAAPGDPRPEHFDRLIRRSKLWCYAKGFNLDGKDLGHSGASPEPWRGAELRFQPRGAAGGRQDGSAKRRRLSRVTERQRSSSKARPPKNTRRNSRKGNAPCKTSPTRNSFSLMGNFPCTPSLVVGEDGDLCPASSLGGKKSWALAKTHPLWRWHLGGSARPAPPSLKFRGCAVLEHP